MNRLSLRIFLSFWVALLLIAAGAFGIALLVFVERAEGFTNSPHALIDGAAAALASGGREGLRGWLERSSRDDRERPRLFVLDDDGADLLARPLPRIARRWTHPEGRLGPVERFPPRHDERDDESEGRAGVDARTSPGMRRPRDFAGGVRLLPPEPLPVLLAPDGSTYRLLILPRRGGAGGYVPPTTMRFAVLALALFVTALVSWLLARSITRPIGDLTGATEALANGQLQAPLAPATRARRDELGRLATSFERMAARIRELLASRERLLRDVSHELRSPLARMRVALGLARRGGDDATRQLDRIELEAERLDTLIGQVLAVSRLDAGKQALAKAPVDIAALVDSIARDAAFEAEAAGRKVEVDTLARDSTIDADATWLGSAIENVVRNAIRHAPAGSAVTLAALRDGGDYVIRVRDRGAGVPDAELERIFEPFHRVAAARERQSGGEGLGLAITARVLKAHGGSVQASNAADGGLIVELRLPLNGAVGAAR